MTDRRILCVWLPGWATTRLHRFGDLPPDRPVATVATARGMRLLADVCPAAVAAGLRVGQKLANARAICPGLVVADADPAAELAALQRLAAWCERYTPLAAADPPDGIVLDITGCAHLFGGEAELAADLAGRLARSGVPCRLAIAGTAAAAWAVTHANSTEACTIVSPGQEQITLASLTIAALRLEADSVTGLRRLGIRTIAELTSLPRAEVTARFGPLPMQRLDQALGHAAEPIAWPHPPLPWEERLVFAEPIGTPEDLARALILTAQRLCSRFATAEIGGHRFAARFFRLDGEVRCIAVGTALPVRDAAYLAKLLTAKLETVDPGFGIEVMALAAEEVGCLKPPQPALKTFAAPDPDASLAGVVDTLANRLPPGRLWRVAPRESFIPERAVQKLPPLAKEKSPAWVPDPSSPRPLRLLRRPEPIEATALLPDEPPFQFRWRGVMHRVRAASGPERIGREWWRRPLSEDRPEADRIRDYYRVEDIDGTRFWVFRVGLGSDGRVPCWFLHGMFG